MTTQQSATNKVVASIQSLKKKSSLQSVPLTQFILISEASQNSIVKVVQAKTKYQQSCVAKIQTESFAILRRFPDIQLTNIYYADDGELYFIGMFNTSVPYYNLIPSVYGNWNVLIGVRDKFINVPSIGSNKVNRIIVHDKHAYITGYYKDSITFDGSYFYNKHDNPTFFIACYNIETDEWLWAKNVIHENGCSSGIELYKQGDNICVLIEYTGDITIDTTPVIRYNKHNHAYAEFKAKDGNWSYVMQTKCNALRSDNDNIYLIGLNEILQRTSVGDGFISIVKQEDKIHKVYFINQEIYIVGKNYFRKHDANKISKGHSFDVNYTIEYFFIDDMNYLSFICRNNISGENNDLIFIRMNHDYEIVYKTRLDFSYITNDVKSDKFEIRDIKYIFDKIYSKIHFVLYFTELNESQIIEYTLDDRWLNVIGIIKSEDTKIGNLVCVEFPGIMSNEYDMQLEIGKEYFIQGDATISTKPNKYYVGTAISNYKMIYH